MRVLTGVLLFLGLVAVVQGMALGSPTPDNWGLHHYAFLSGGWLAAGFILSVLVFLLVWLRPGWLAFRLPPLAAALILAAGFAVLFWMARQDLHFLGSGDLRIESLRQGRFVWITEPLGIFIPYTLYRWFTPSDPAVIFAGLSVLSGALFVVLAFWFARMIGKDGWEQAVVFGLLVTAGFTRLFYGYVETYPLLALVSFLYLVLGVRVARGKGSPLVLGAAVCAAFLVHSSAVILLPSFYYAVFRREASGRNAERWAAAVLPVAVLAAGQIYLGARGTGLLDVFGGYASRFFPLDGGLTPRLQYTLLDPGHFRDFFEAQMLLGPFSALFALVLLLFGGEKLLGKDGRFLLVAAIPWWILSFLLSPELGPARQWDLFAASAIPWVMIAALVLARLPRPHSGSLRLAAGLVVGLAVFHSFAWIGIGTSGERTLPWFVGLHGPGSSAAPFARSQAFDDLGAFYMSKGILDNADTAFKEAVTADTTNTYAAGHLASLYLSTGRVPEAAAILTWASRKTPNRETLQYDLGRARQSLGQSDSAAVSFRRALDLNPDYLQAYVNLADIERERQNLEESERLLDRAEEKFPGNVLITGSRGLLARARGDTLQAISLLRQAAEVDTANADLFFNLGSVLMQAGRPDEAARSFQNTVRIRPRDAQAWVRLGAARQRLGEDEEALAAFEQAVLADPTRPEGYLNIFQMRLAAGDTSLALLALRTYAARDSTSGYGRLVRDLIQEVTGEAP